MAWLAHPVGRSSRTPCWRYGTWTPASVRALARRCRLKQHQRIVSAHRFVIPHDGGGPRPESAGPASDHRQRAVMRRLIRRARASPRSARSSSSGSTSPPPSPSSTASSTKPTDANAVLIASASRRGSGPPRCRRAPGTGGGTPAFAPPRRPMGAGRPHRALRGGQSRQTGQPARGRDGSPRLEQRRQPCRRSCGGASPYRRLAIGGVRLRDRCLRSQSGPGSRRRLLAPRRRTCPRRRPGPGSTRRRGRSPAAERSA